MKSDLADSITMDVVLDDGCAGEQRKNQKLRLASSPSSNTVEGHGPIRPILMTSDADNDQETLIWFQNIYRESFEFIQFPFPTTLTCKKQEPIRSFDQKGIGKNSILII